MMTIRRTGDYRAIPMLICDVCMKPIEDTGRANTVWFEEIETPGDECVLYVVHQGKCDSELSRRHSHQGRFHNLRRAMELSAGRIWDTTSLVKP